MPIIQKPSTWKAPTWQFSQENHEEVIACYPSDVMREIVSAAHLEKVQPDAGKRAELAKMIEHNIINLGVWAKNWINLTGRPTPAQRKAALSKVQSAAITLSEVLNKLDSDSSDDLRRAMLADEFSQHAIGVDPNSEVPGPLRGYAKYQTLIDIIQKIEQWATTAQVNTAKPKDGNKPADIKRWYAAGLIDIWLMIGYVKPTLTTDAYSDPSKTTGPLMEFTNLAARPLGLTPMEAALRQAISEWKKKG